jgi:hypothetical protein
MSFEKYSMKIPLVYGYKILIIKYVSFYFIKSMIVSQKNKLHLQPICST